MTSFLRRGGEKQEIGEPDKVSDNSAAWKRKGFWEIPIFVDLLVKTETGGTAPDFACCRPLLQFEMPALNPVLKLPAGEGPFSWHLRSSGLANQRE